MRKMMLVILACSYLSARADGIIERYEDQLAKATSHAIYAKAEASLFARRAKEAARYRDRLKAELKAYKAKERALGNIVNREYDMSKQGLESPSYGRYQSEDLLTGGKLL